MKNLLLAAILIMLTFLSCSKEDDEISTTTDTTIYEGTWRGTFSGGSSGTWIYNVTGVGTLTGSATVADGTMHTKTGTVSASGLVNVTISNGGSNTGQFNAETGIYAGTWKNNDPNNPLSGSLSGTKD
ncbi:MAG: hypothetical protein HKO66_06525 [Saprospiraceae bacterium]|nr:hypothetical protein [Bacteroidia bacterium]NNL91867.1 hypothetical protein [Saprospiraceae bacterium]